VSRLILPLLVPALLALLCQCAAPPRRAASPPPATPDTARWTRVTGRLAQAAPADDRGKPVPWAFSLRNAHGINARSWPDGRVEVNAGTLTFVENDSELAAVLAHEMAHVTGGHHRKQIAESWVNLLAGAALAAILTHQGTDAGPAAALATGAVLTVNVTALAARRRAREAEADRLSLDLLRQAGYPPQAAVDFWERYAVARLATGHRSGNWWQSHPADHERISRLRRMTATR
jgi:predicted Zn-dependent protease